jgi:serine/threonine protein kinase
MLLDLSGGRGPGIRSKLVQPSLLGSADAIARFLDEARITARFDHPHIVTIHAVGELAGRRSPR